MTGSTMKRSTSKNIRSSPKTNFTASQRTLIRKTIEKIDRMCDLATRRLGTQNESEIEDETDYAQTFCVLSAELCKQIGCEKI